MGLHDRTIGGCTRRAFALGLSLSGAWCLRSTPLLAHASAGPVDPPKPPPSVELQLEDDTASTLQAVLIGRVTALQLMFTSCQAACPIQGALFAEAAKKLGDRSNSAQLLSMSIDPDHDTPALLREWLKRFGASPRWRAARPNKAQLEALSAFLKSKQAGPDPHTAQVYYFDTQGRLVLRSVDFPPADDVARSLERLAKARS
jgi:protein SCO1/2